MTTAAATPPAKKAKQTTEYVVLRAEMQPRTGSDGGSTEAHSVVQTIAATSANDAIRQAAGEKPGTYRAIPARSWKPVKVTVSTETKITLG